MPPVKTPPAQIIECGCCGSFHREAYHGDCRNDAERFADPQESANRLGCETVQAFEDGTGGETFVPGQDKW